MVSLCPYIYGFPLSFCIFESDLYGIKPITISIENASNALSISVPVFIIIVESITHFYLP